MTERWGAKCKLCAGSGDSKWWDKLFDLDSDGVCKACNGNGYLASGLDFPAYVEDHNAYCKDVLDEIDKEKGK